MLVLPGPEAMLLSSRLPTSPHARPSSSRLLPRPLLFYLLHHPPLVLRPPLVDEFLRRNLPIHRQGIPRISSYLILLQSERMLVFEQMAVGADDKTENRGRGDEEALDG